MINKVKAFVLQWNMIQAGDKIVAGVSGGADSVCLLYLLKEIQKSIPFEIIVVHVEHGIRGQSSLDDAVYVKSLAEKFGLCYKQFDYKVREFASNEKISEEEAGRILRYESFELAVKEFKADKVAVAHHQEDNAETILMNLFRGTGLKGMSGIMPVRDNIIRPLLCLGRMEIEEYLMREDIMFKTDPTNLDDEYTRNKLRLNIFPYVQDEINSKAIWHINQAAAQMREAYDCLKEIADNGFDKAVNAKNEEIELILSSLEKEDVFIQKMIIQKAIELLSKSSKDISAVHIESIIELKEKQVGKKIVLPYDIVAYREYDKVVFKKTENDDNKDINELIDYEIKKMPCQIILPNNGLFQCNVVKNSDVYEKRLKIPEKTCTKWLDYDKIKNNLTLRTRRPGDFIEINAKGNRKKIKEYFIENKVPREQRSSILLLAEGSHIIWILGYRISEYYKVGQNTTQILEVKVNGGLYDGR